MQVCPENKLRLQKFFEEAFDSSFFPFSLRFLELQFWRKGLGMLFKRQVARLQISTRHTQPTSKLMLHLLPAMQTQF